MVKDSCNARIELRHETFVVDIFLCIVHSFLCEGYHEIISSLGAKTIQDKYLKTYPKDMEQLQYVVQKSVTTFLSSGISGSLSESKMLKYLHSILSLLVGGKVINAIEQLGLLMIMKELHSLNSILLSYHSINL